MRNLDVARTNLIINHPFFASLLLRMPLIEDASVATAATNGKCLRYNPTWLGKLSAAETEFTLAHEVMHKVFQHMTRRGTMSHNRFNQAADYVINGLLVADGVGRMPAGGLHNPQLVAAGGGTTEGVYKLLPESDEGKGPGKPGGSLDDVQDAADDEAGLAEAEEETKVEVIQAANAAKAMGRLSGGLERIVGELTRRRADWRAVLRRFMTERAKTDWSYAKPKRRFMAEDIYLPGLVGERMGEVVVALDCSGSVDEALLAKFGAEAKAIAEDAKPAKLHVIYFDAQVLRHDVFLPDDDIVIKPCGGGGTAFEPIFAYVEANDINPVATVVLTDMYGSFGEAPSYPVLWAATTAEVAPWGETLRVEE
jgi:predicted metal-dependent peptidase